MSWFLVHSRGLVVRREAGRIELPGDDDVAALSLGPTEELGGGHRAASIADAALPESLQTATLRELFVPLGESLWLTAGRAAQIVDWATTHRYCGRCATGTERVEGERCMRCPACGLACYPRISPAVIVLVRRGDEALLARNARFPAAFYSTLAGFVEVGESLEQTVAREIREEAGIEVGDVRYFGSQPWPFPHSLMVGFTARWTGGDVVADGDEILDARWFRADALPPLPPPLSIARRLIDGWVAEVSR